VADRRPPGACPLDPSLGRIRHVDLRTLNYPARTLLTAEQLREPRSYTWAPVVEALDQGPDGACVGFAWAHELAARPGVISGVSYSTGMGLYRGAQLRDPWPGGAYLDRADPDFYEGTSVSAGGAEAKARGLISEYRWAYSLPEFASVVSYFGPGVVGVEWYTSMFEPDRDGFVRPGGWVAGGHAVCVYGVRVRREPSGRIDPVRSYFTVRNSWGPGWGVGGDCRISFVDMAVLWPSGEFCIPVGRKKAVLA